MLSEVILKIGDIELTHKCPTYAAALRDAYYLSHKIASNCVRIPGTDTWKIKSGDEWINSWQINIKKGGEQNGKARKRFLHASGLHSWTL